MRLPLLCQPTLSSGRAGSSPRAVTDIGAILTLADRSGRIFRDPKMPTHWSPPEVSPVGFGSCHEGAGGRSERRVPCSLMGGGRHRARLTEPVASAQLKSAAPP